jgi:hypothetical protein
VLNEFYRVASRKKVYRSIDELQADLDRWITEYNEARHIKAAGASAKHRCDDNGEDDRSLITLNIKTRSLKQASGVRSSPG